jgi:Amiloride-sensitive sodium channel
MFCVLMLKTTNKLWSDKIVITTSTEPILIQTIPFPAVTVCPQIVSDTLLQTFENELEELSWSLDDER